MLKNVKHSKIRIKTKQTNKKNRTKQNKTKQNYNNSNNNGHNSHGMSESLVKNWRLRGRGRVSWILIRAIASLSDGQDKSMCSIFLHFLQVSFIFPQIFFLILVFLLGGRPWLCIWYCDINLQCFYCRRQEVLLAI